MSKLSRTKSFEIQNMHILSQITVFKTIYYQKTILSICVYLLLKLKIVQCPNIYSLKSEKSLHQNQTLLVNTRNNYEMKK